MWKLAASGNFLDSYRGLINDGTVVVIERFEPILGLQGVREFQTEVKLLYQLHHPHLVSFIGFYDEKDEKFIVYEYVSNGSLDKHLYGDCSDHPLSWIQRLEICIGAARGLHYLHSGAKHSVIHHKISTQKIVLDENWTARLSDLNLRFVGTAFNMDPKCYKTGRMTTKYDVYYFGVVLYEVSCGRNVINRTLMEDEMDLISCTCKCIENGTIYQIIDPYLKNKIAPESFKKFVEVAYCCVCETRNGRPQMGEVQMVLEVALGLQKKADSEKESVYLQDE